VFNPHFAAGTGSSNQNGNSSCNGGDRYQNRRLGSYPRFRAGTPNWSFVFDPAGRLCYYWSMVVSLAFLYNFWVIIYRFAFQEINGQWLRSACSVVVTKHTLVGSVFVPILHFDELWLLTLRQLMFYIYIYGAPILDVSRSHTTTQHSR